MNKISCLLIMMFGIQFLYAQGVFLNEIRANNAGTDDGEFIEIIGPAGSDISGWQLEHINGNGSAEIFSFTFPPGTLIPDDGIFDVTGQHIGFIVIKRTAHNVENFDFEWGSSSLQNGPDGIILRNSDDVRIQALAWNGLGDLDGGNPVWREIGSDLNDDNSLSAPDSVFETYKADWDYVSATPGWLNSNQTAGDISLPVELSSFKAIAGDGQIRLIWKTESEVDNLGFILERSLDQEHDYLEIGHYESLASLRSSGNQSRSRNYSFIDKSVYNGISYWYRLSDVSRNGQQTWHPVVNATPAVKTKQIDVIPESNSPSAFRLHPNYPNPFNPDTRIRFEIPKVGLEPVYTNLIIYDALGREVKELINGPLVPNIYEIDWKGQNNNNLDVASGIYYYVLRTPEFYQSRKMILLR